MSSIDEVAAQFGMLTKEFDKPDADLDRCQALLNDLKACLGLSLSSAHLSLTLFVYFHPDCNDSVFFPAALRSTLPPVTEASSHRQ